MPEGGVLVSTCLVADQTGSVHLQLWGPEVEAFNPGDILRLYNGSGKSLKHLTTFIIMRCSVFQHFHIPEFGSIVEGWKEGTAGENWRVRISLSSAFRFLKLKKPELLCMLF